MAGTDLTLDTLAFLTIILWPAIPLFWIPVHCRPEFFRRLQGFTYLLPLLTWLPYAYLAFRWRDALLLMRTALPALLNITGGVFFASGIALHLWTGKLLGLKGLVGLPEVAPQAVAGRLITTGPFALVRHPTYLAHTLLYFGVFLLTGNVAVGASVVIDLTVINLLVIPLEERELKERFGDEYSEYVKRVRNRFIPIP